MTKDEKTHLQAVMKANGLDDFYTKWQSNCNHLFGSGVHGFSTHGGETVNILPSCAHCGILKSEWEKYLYLSVNTYPRRSAADRSETRAQKARLAGIFALVCVIPVVQVVIALIAIGLCTYALKRSASWSGGHRRAQVGLICSIAGLVIGIVVIVVLMR